MPSESKPKKTAVTVLTSRTSRIAVIGLLVTALAVPAFAVTSFASASTIKDFDALPGYLEIGSQPSQNTIYATKDDKQVAIATVYSQNRQEIAWADVSDTLKDAVLAAEDHRFYEHGGIDVQGIVRAVVTDVTTGSAQGASTLTQQTVKNVCIAEAFKNYPDQETDTKEFAKYKAAVTDCNEGTIDRKIREMKYAIGLEKEYSKNEILLAYLNIANYGGTVYGIQSAAQRYYNVDAKDLTLVQAASLIAIVQKPDARRLDFEKNYAANTERRDSIIKNMATYGYITTAERDKALAVKEGSKNDTLDVTPTKNGCAAANTLARQFCDYVVKNVKNYAALGDTQKERLETWRIGGFSVYTTLDLTLQKVAQEAVRQYAPADATQFSLGASAVSVQTGTGRILTMAQNKRFDDTGNGSKKTTTAVNFNTDKDYGGSSGFQVGSTYKTFTLINWLESGHGLNEYVQGNARTVNQADFTDSCNGPWVGSYKFRNDAAGGYPSVRNATAQSINGAFITMGLQLDLCKTRKIAQSLGVHLAAGKADGSDLDTRPSSILGINNIAPLTVAAAYAGIANNGNYCTPVAVDKFVTSAGKDLGGQVTKCDQAIPEDVAVATQSALQTAMQGYQSNPRDGTQLIGKTGTTNGSDQTWVTGASTAVATTVWFGNITGHYPIRSYYAPGLSGGGGNARHLIMHAILTEQDKLYPGEDFETLDPSSALARGQTQVVGNYANMSEAKARAAAIADGFSVASESGTVASDLPEDEVAATNPGAGRTVSKGTQIQLLLSDASQTEVPDVTGTDVGSAQNSLMADGFSNIGTYCVAQGTVDPTTGTLPDGSSPDADGTVVEQAPDAGTVKSMDGRVRLGVAAATC